MKVSAEVIPFEDCEKKNLFHASLLASGGLLENTGTPWLVEASL